MISSHRNAIIYAALIALGGFVFGFDAAVIGGVIGFITSQFELTPWQVGMVVSSPTAAAVLASFTIGFVSDLFGRRKVLLALAALYLISAAASAFSAGFVTLTIARAIGGYAFGSLTQSAIYIAEISPARYRGRMVAMNQMAIVVGISAAYFVNLGIQTLAISELQWTIEIGLAEEPWRWMLGVEMVPAALWLVALFIVPESPRWLATKQRWDEARSILNRVVPHEEIEQVIADMKTQFGTAAQMSFPSVDDLFGPKIRFALLIGFIVAVIQQITGINIVFFYATTIFEQSGVGTNAAFTQAVFVGLINIVFTVVAMMAIDRFGRRPLMLIGLSGVLVSMSLVAYGFQSATYHLTPEAIAQLADSFDKSLLTQMSQTIYPSDLAYKTALIELLGSDFVRDNQAVLINAAMKGNPRIILAGILGFVASFALSLGPVMWVFLSEIFPNRVRGVAISMITVFNSGSSWLVQFLFPIQLAYTGIASVFAGYAFFALVGLILVAWLMPETSGLSLEEIEKTIAAKSGIREESYES